MKLNIDKEQIGGIVKSVCNIVVFGALLGASLFKKEREVSTTVRIGETNYSDAIDAVLRSDMMSSTKTEVIDAVKRHEDSEYYKAVISVVNSDMLGSLKYRTIKSLSGE